MVNSTVSRGGTIAVRPASDYSYNVPTARVKSIQDGYGAMPGVNVPNSRPLTNQRDGEKGLVASDSEIVRRNEKVGIGTSGANNLDLIKSIPVNGAFTLNDLVNLISNGKRIVLPRFRPGTVLSINTEKKKLNMAKMLVFILHPKVNAKLTSLNEITRNLFVKHAKSDS